MSMAYSHIPLVKSV